MLALLLLLSLGSLQAADSVRAVAEANAGLALARQGKYDQALPRYRAALALDPHLPGLQLNLGLAYLKLDRLPEAAIAFEHALKADPTSFQVQTLLGMTYFGCRRFEDAAPHLKAAAGRQPDNTELRYKLAQSYLYSKRYEEAKEEFRFLLTKDPDSAAVHLLLGEVLDAAGQTEQAVAEFEAAVKSPKREPEAHFGLGYLYWKQRRYEDALRQFLAQLESMPQHSQALTYAGDSEMHTGHEKEAREHLRQAVKLDPGIRLAQLDYGVLLADAGDSAGAERCYREAIRIDATNPDAHYRLGRLLLSMGRRQEAQAEFDKVKELGQAQEKPLIEIPGQKP